MKFIPTKLQDAFLIELKRIGDDRGFFARTYCQDAFEAHGIRTTFVQQNTSYSSQQGTLRGLHFQHSPHAENKLIRCFRGAIFDVIIDLRKDSPTYLHWQGFELNEDNKHQLFVPEGFAHGFQAITPDIEVSYLVSARYAPAAEGGLRWDDPAFGIEWPMPPTEISDKDRNWPDFTES